MDTPRGRGVQFPFVVTDRVIIKVSRVKSQSLALILVQLFVLTNNWSEMSQGNKRTPQRFVGREAVVTTQCLNGW